MKIDLSPKRHDQALSVFKSGDSLTINGEIFDFGPLEDGAILPREAVDCASLAADIERVGGDLHLALYLPHNADAPQSARFPAPLLDVADGKVPLPTENPDWSGAMKSGALDWSKVVTAEARAEQSAARRLKAAKEECRARIYAIASAETQMNMATAAAIASGVAEADRTPEQAALLAGAAAALGWVDAMRGAVATVAENNGADISDDASWPPPPPEALAVAAMF